MFRNSFFIFALVVTGSAAQSEVSGDFDPFNHPSRLLHLSQPTIDTARLARHPALSKCGCGGHCFAFAVPFRTDVWKAAGVPRIPPGIEIALNSGSGFAVGPIQSIPVFPASPAGTDHHAKQVCALVID